MTDSVEEVLSSSTESSPVSPLPPDTDEIWKEIDTAPEEAEDSIWEAVTGDNVRIDRENGYAQIDEFRLEANREANTLTLSHESSPVGDTPPARRPPFFAIKGAEGKEDAYILIGAQGITPSTDITEYAIQIAKLIIKNLLPDTTGAYTLGDDLHRWKGVYISEILDIIKDAKIGGDLNVIGKASFGSITAPLASSSVAGVLKVNITGSGNVIIGASISGGVLTLQKGSPTCSQMGCYNRCDSCCPDCPEQTGKNKTKEKKCPNLDDDMKMLVELYNKRMKDMEGRIKSLEKKK
jgi:hypothetical protein